MTMESPLGVLRLYATADELIGVYLRLQRTPEAVEGRSALLVRAADQLTEYFAGHRAGFDLALAPRGTPFQTLIWRTLLAIPHGETTSYGELARSIGRPAASRAVGAANGSNPISIIVPCHRVVGANGALTGYGGGLAAKRWLLDHERAYAGHGPGG